MRKSLNLKTTLRQYLPIELCKFVDLAVSLAEQQDMHLYLVGGAVRDLLLQRPNMDLDLVVEGDATRLAGE